MSPTNSFKSAETIKQYNEDVKKVLKEKADANGMAKMTQKEFDDFRTKRLVLASSMSPDTGEVIPWPTRTCSFVPTNIPIILGMLISPPSTFSTILWQWINQTYNAGLNFGNRNASSQQTNGEMFQAYCIATATAIAVAGSLKALQPTLLKGRSGGIAALATYFISYSAVASSSSVNVYVMRMGEITSGVSVKDEATGEDYGLSKVAAASGINKTMICRCTYTLPIFFIPAAWSTLLTKLSIMPKRLNLGKVLLETLGVTIGLLVAMPLNCALFP